MRRCTGNNIAEGSKGAFEVADEFRIVEDKLVVPLQQPAPSAHFSALAMSGFVWDINDIYV
jgi:hypothetical protein